MNEKRKKRPLRREKKTEEKKTILIWKFADVFSIANKMTYDFEKNKQKSKFDDDDKQTNKADDNLIIVIVILECQT